MIGDINRVGVLFYIYYGFMEIYIKIVVIGKVRGVVGVFLLMFNRIEIYWKLSSRLCVL